MSGRTLDNCSVHNPGFVSINGEHHGIQARALASAVGAPSLRKVRNAEQGRGDTPHVPSLEGKTP